VLAAKGIRTGRHTAAVRLGEVRVGNYARKEQLKFKPIKKKWMPNRLEGHLEYGGLRFDGAIIFHPTGEEQGADEVLSRVGKLERLRPVPVSEIEHYVKQGERILDFEAEPDAEGKLAAIASKLAEKGFCLAIPIATKAVMA